MLSARLSTQVNGPDEWTQTHKVAVPTPFDMLKWKSQEFEKDTLKFRTVVSYKNHSLQTHCRTISRCLQKGLEELMASTLALGFPGLLGVRDLVFAMRRVGGWTWYVRTQRNGYGRHVLEDTTDRAGGLSDVDVVQT